MKSSGFRCPVADRCQAWRDRLLFWGAPRGSQHTGILRQHRPPTKRQPDICRDHRTRYVDTRYAGMWFAGDGWEPSMPRVRCPQEEETRALTYPADVRAVDRDTLGPILFLLQSPDIEVQRAASAALGNLAVNSAFPKPEGRSGSWNANHSCS